MPRAPRITAGEFARRNPEAKGIFRTDRRGVKIFIAFEKKHPFPQGKGIRVSFGRGTRENLTDQLRLIKRNQEKAERKVKVKKGIGLFDNPLANSPNVVGVKRIVRKKQLESQIRRYEQGKSKKISSRALDKLRRRKGGKGSIKGVLVQKGSKGSQAGELTFLALTGKRGQTSE